MNKRLTVIISILALLGLGIAIYSFLHNQAFASGEFCQISESFNCDIVNKGPFSKFFGIPVALIGIIGYVLLLVSALIKLKQPADRGLTNFLTLAALGGLAFSLYLTSLEAFVLHSWCLLCLVSQALILLIAILSCWLWLREKKGKVVSGTIIEETIIIEKSSRDL
ncbi:vitamin K epoxide reductase family protein [Patescibacteria group bacterium]